MNITAENITTANVPLHSKSPSHAAKDVAALPDALPKIQEDTLHLMGTLCVIRDESSKPNKNNIPDTMAAIESINSASSEVDVLAKNEFMVRSILARKELRYSHIANRNVLPRQFNHVLRRLIAKTFFVMFEPDSYKSERAQSKAAKATKRKNNNNK
jgi:hypothetical protein